MTQYPKYIYARLVNLGTDDQFMLTGTELSEIETQDNVHEKTARYKLVGIGEVHHSAPVYVEDTGT